MNIFKSSFENFKSDKKYDLILIFGLIQILFYNQSLILAEKVSSLSKKGTTVLITSFSEKDDTFNFYKNNYQEYRTNYFVNIENKYRSFPSITEITELFSGFELTMQNEYTGPMHRHGNNPPEKHEMIELTLKNQT